ncbi:DUF4400 domain-containing protein [Methylibium petroleiphilum]|uniref:DUF4400 domain-containing protein n=1 Tax=Methylibium petroleiphilum TaxID=105560 RepID=UPI001AC81335|nr:DUF4400 domain-containing protein [Methylibium petroleiphilum]MBN9206111.1 DUF4400 domain-containing protein [Methylibium petroleiphilum]
MIRVVAVVSLLCLLVLVLYLPSAHPADRFLAQLRAEHDDMTAFWGGAPALRILSRTLSLQDSARQATPVPAANDAPPASAVDGAVAQEMASVNRRLFDNAYFRSIDALVLLAAFRLSTLLEWLPWLAAFCAAALVDGLGVRLVKSKEFRHHDPELFAVFACLGIVTACAAVVAFVVPVSLHPLAIPTVPLLISLLVGKALANFHRRA